MLQEWNDELRAERDMLLAMLNESKPSDPPVTDFTPISSTVTKRTAISRLERELARRAKEKKAETLNGSHD